PHHLASPLLMVKARAEGARVRRRPGRGTGDAARSYGRGYDPLQATEQAMDTITTNDGTTIFFKDMGPREATPIVFHHGWPLSADDWDNQLMFFLGHGFRVIAHDRRGHGRSTQTGHGNEMDTYAADVVKLAATLDLRN